MLDKGSRHYIVTEISGEKRILYMNKCNFCPFFKINPSNKMSYCTNIHTLDENIEHIRAYTFSGKNGNYVPLSVINIPIFCKLPTMVSDVISLTSMDINKIQIISDKYVKFDKDLNVILIDSINSLSSQKNTYNNINSDAKNCYNRKSNPITPSGTLQTVEKSEIPTREQPTYTTRNYNNSNASTYKSFEKCSCCGKMYKSVERDKNDGMCETCIENFSNNEEKLQFAKMNNFRLKRKSEFSEKKFKIIV